MPKPNWSIVNLERHLSDGAVYTAHWTAVLEESGESTSAYGSVGFGEPNPDLFIPFNSLTEEKVLDWVFNALGVDQVVNIEETLYNQIQEKISPKDAAGVPW